MTLDDLFAKKAKKKTKKKHNPQDLLEQLTKEVSKQQDPEGDITYESTKTITSLGKDDEWEIIEDDEKEIDIQSLQFGKLALNATVEPKQPSKEKSDKDGPGEMEEEKKVWGAKVPETPVVEEPVAEEKPSEKKPSVYIPLHLRQGAPRGPREPKPNVESIADFPTLDAALTPEPAPTKAQTKAEQEEEASWEQAGAPRKPVRTSEKLPIAVNPAPSAYVPPALRAGGAPTSRMESTFGSRPRDEFTHRNEPGSGYRRSEGFAPRDPPSTFADASSWSRGQPIVRGSGVSGAAPIAAPLPMLSRSSAVSSGASGGGSDWERGAAMKTFRETDREKKQFELVQTNRFAGLGET